MSFRKPFSSIEKAIKDRFRGSKRNRDKKGPNISEERANLEESLSRSESPLAGGGDRDLGESGSNPVGGHISSNDPPAQQEELEPMPVSENETSREEEGERSVDQIEPSQTQRPRPRPTVEAVVGGGHGDKVERVPSDTFIPDSVKPDGM